MSTPIRPVLAALAVSLALAPPAAAQDPQVDPNSPAGSEYELPLDRAREEAGTSDSSAAAAGKAPLFGEGVEAKVSAKATKAAVKPAADKAPTRTANVKPDDPAVVRDSVRAHAVSPEGGGGLLPVGAGACAVLLLGGLAGIVWRRRSMEDA